MKNVFLAVAMVAALGAGVSLSVLAVDTRLRDQAQEISLLHDEILQATQMIQQLAKTYDARPGSTANPRPDNYIVGDGPGWCVTSGWPPRFFREDCSTPITCEDLVAGKMP